MTDDDLYDAGDAWSRLSRRIKDLTTESSQVVLAGQCSPEQYQSLCARIMTLNEMIDLMHEIRSGADRPAKPGRLVLPEENDPEIAPA